MLKILLPLLAAPVLATGSFTTEEVAEHSAVDDCYMTFESKVYDFTDYLAEHEEKFLDISPWCGQDMTEAFKTKDGRDRDHKAFSYELLEDYYIGDLTTVTEKTGQASTESPYNFAIPFFATVGLYLITKLLSKSGKIEESLHDFLWNSALIVSLIPSILFGFYLLFGYNFPKLREVDFDFLYWHVEGSVVFGTVCILHLVERLRVYFSQMKSSTD